AVALFLSMWFFAVMPILIKAGSISKIASNPLVLVATGSYAVALFLSMWFFAVMPILIKAGSISKIASNPLV
ncbi:hypothetical protein BUE67_16105, partial [Corynebacterium diphtheriae]